MNTDPIADLLTQIRNALNAGHRMVELPASNLKIEVVRTLLDEGYIKSYELKEEPKGRFKLLRILLKYDKNGYPIIRKIKRMSRPGLRRYANSKNIPRILNGAGCVILSTNKGVISDRAARREKVGGELLCFVE